MKKIQDIWYSVGKKIKVVRYTLEIHSIIAREVIRSIVCIVYILQKKNVIA